MKRLPILLLIIVSLVSASAEDLVTRDGKVYHGYTVLGHDAGYLTIMYSEGGGKVPLSELPDDLQKKFGYDKAKADAFVEAAVEQDRHDRQAIADEQDQHAKQIAAHAQAEAAPVAEAAPAVAPAEPASNPAAANAVPHPPPPSGALLPTNSVAAEAPSDVTSNPAAANAVPHPPPSTAVPDASTSASITPAAAAAVPMTPTEIDATEAKIGELTNDVQYMNSVQGVDADGGVDPTVESSKAYDTKIADEKDQLQQLKDKLKVDNRIATQSITTVSQEDLDVMYQKIVDLRLDVKSRVEGQREQKPIARTAQLDTVVSLTRGAAEEKVASDQAEIARLKNRLSLLQRKIPPLSVDKRAALKEELKDLVFHNKPVYHTGVIGMIDDLVIKNDTKIEELQAAILGY